MVQGGLLGQLLGVDVNNGRAHLLDDGGEAVGERDGIGQHQGARVAGVHSLAVGAYVAGNHGAGQDADGQGREQGEDGGEATVAEICPQLAAEVLNRLHGLVSSSVSL